MKTRPTINIRDHRKEITKRIKQSLINLSVLNFYNQITGKYIISRKTSNLSPLFFLKKLSQKGFQHNIIRKELHNYFKNYFLNYHFSVIRLLHKQIFTILKTFRKYHFSQYLISSDALKQKSRSYLVASKTELLKLPTIDMKRRPCLPVQKTSILIANLIEKIHSINNSLRNTISQEGGTTNILSHHLHQRNVYLHDSLHYLVELSLGKEIDIFSLISNVSQYYASIISAHTQRLASNERLSRAHDIGKMRTHVSFSLASTAHDITDRDLASYIRKITIIGLTPFRKTVNTQIVPFSAQAKNYFDKLYINRMVSVQLFIEKNVVGSEPSLSVVPGINQFHASARAFWVNSNTEKQLLNVTDPVTIRFFKLLKRNKTYSFTKRISQSIQTHTRAKNSRLLLSKHFAIFYQHRSASSTAITDQFPYFTTKTKTELANAFNPISTWILNLFHDKKIFSSSLGISSFLKHRIEALNKRLGSMKHFSPTNSTFPLSNDRNNRLHKKIIYRNRGAELGVTTRTLTSTLSITTKPQPRECAHYVTLNNNYSIPFYSCRPVSKKETDVPEASFFENSTFDKILPERSNVQLSNTVAQPAEQQVQPRMNEIPLQKYFHIPGRQSQRFKEKWKDNQMHFLLAHVVSDHFQSDAFFPPVNKSLSAIKKATHVHAIQKVMHASDNVLFPLSLKNQISARKQKSVLFHRVLPDNSRNKSDGFVMSNTWRNDEWNIQSLFTRHEQDNRNTYLFMKANPGDIFFTDNIYKNPHLTKSLYNDYPQIIFQKKDDVRKNDYADKNANMATQDHTSDTKNYHTETIQHEEKQYREIQLIVDEVYRTFEKRLRLERERRGL